MTRTAPPNVRASRRLRGRLLASVLALTCLAVLSGARCYPAGTRVIVFMQGIYSTYGADGTQDSVLEGHRFNVLKATFTARGYPREAMLDFSYAGGTVRNDGSWLPAPYACEQTDRTTADNLVPLEKMLRDYRARHPNAHFTLVGHSLGGDLAFVEGAREADRSEAQRLGVDSVVTLDAQLMGISPDKKTIIDIIPCEKTYIAGAEIVSQKFDLTIPETRNAQAGAMAAAGIRLATLGNEWDCLLNTGHCLPGGTWVDDSATQIVAGAAFSRSYQIESSPLLSHDAILADPGANEDVATFVGAR